MIKNIAIYQINLDLDDERLAFTDYLKDGRVVPDEIYECVYEGEIDILVDPDSMNPDFDALEHIYRVFNLDHPLGYKGRSISVSDIVEMDGKYYFCSNFGWKEVNPN